MSKILNTSINSFLRPNEIIAQECAKLDFNEILHLPKNKNIRDKITKYRKKYLKNTHDNNGEDNEDIYTLNGNKFLQVNEEVDNGQIKIFFNESHINYIINSKIWIGDGTFKSVPKEFKQLYVFHCQIRNSFFPLIYILMPDKSFQSYKFIFKYIRSFSKEFKLEQLVVDMEYAVIKAAKCYFQTINIQLCYFHFTQSIWRKLQQLGLQKFYYLQTDFRYLFKILCALPFEKTKNIINCFQILKEKSRKFEENNIKILFNYFEKNFIKQELKNTNNEYMWSIHYSFIKDFPYTTNVSEAWNRGINSVFRMYNKINFIDFVRELKTRDFNVSCRINELFYCANININKKFQNKKEKLKNIFVKYDTFNETEFISLIANINDINDYFD